MKSEYVAKGYSQVEGIDYQETFAPTGNITHNTTARSSRWTAYLHAPVDQGIFMDQSEGFATMSENEERIVYKLRKSLYGLKQSGRNWNKVLHDHLVRAGFDRNPVDHCIYSKQVSNNLSIFLIWVDDLIVASGDIDLMNQFKDGMKRQFKTKDLGRISLFLGIDFNQSFGLIKMN